MTSLLPPPTADEIAAYLRDRIAKNEKAAAEGRRENLKKHERLCDLEGLGFQYRRNSFFANIREEFVPAAK